MERKRLQIHIVEARRLASKDKNGFSDPYCVLKMGGQKTKSKIMKMSLNPVFNEKFTFEIKSKDFDVLNIQLFDYDKGLSADDFLGQVKLNIGDLKDEESGLGNGKWYPLQKRSEKSRISGDIFIELSFIDSNGNIQTHVVEEPLEKSLTTKSMTRVISGAIDVVRRSQSSPATPTKAIEECTLESYDGTWMLKVKVMNGKDLPRFPDIVKPTNYCTLSLIGHEKSVRTATKLAPTNNPCWDDEIRLSGIQNDRLVDMSVKLEVYTKEIHRTQVIGKTKFPLSRVPCVMQEDDFDGSTGAQELQLIAPRRARILSPAASLIPGRGRGSVIIDLVLVPDVVGGDEESDDFDEVNATFNSAVVEGITPIEWPPPLAWIIIDEELSINVAKLHKVMFGKNSKFVAAFQQAQNYTDIVETDWGGDDCARTSREIGYMMPATSMVKANRATETQSYEVQESGGYVVNVSTATPDAPYGSCYLAKVQFCLNHVDKSKSKLRVSADMEFTKSTMMKSAVQGGAKKGMTITYNNYLDLLQQSISKKRGPNRIVSSVSSSSSTEPSCSRRDIIMITLLLIVSLLAVYFYYRLQVLYDEILLLHEKQEL